MDTILGDIATWFIAREPALRIFADHDCRVEGWFKGEMLLCLEDLRRRGRVGEFEREFTVGRRGWGEKDQKKIDFRIMIDRVDHLCELKALCISQAYGTARNLDFYFRKDSAVGLWKDFRKLESIPTEPAKWILSFIYPAPTAEKWNQTLEKWANTIGGWLCQTTPQTYPDWLFVALWKPGAQGVASSELTRG